MTPNLRKVKAVPNKRLQQINLRHLSESRLRFLFIRGFQEDFVINKPGYYYRCVEDHFEQLEAVWDERYLRRFGFWRPYVTDVIQRYLDCGDLHFGFARVKCEDCGHEYLLAFSCKRRHFCPSCHQKRVVEFGEWLCTEVLKYVPHRQWVFSIPKRLRIYFMMDRKLLAKLSQCAWKVLNLYLTQIVPYDDAKAGATRLPVVYLD